MKGEYDIVKEETELTNLIRAVGQRGDVADKIIERLGIFALLGKVAEEQEAGQERAETGESAGRRAQS